MRAIVLIYVLLSFTVFLAIDQAVPVPHLQRLSDNPPPLKMPMQGATSCTTYKFAHLVHTLSPSIDTYYTLYTLKNQYVQ